MFYDSRVSFRVCCNAMGGRTMKKMSIHWVGGGKTTLVMPKEDVLMLTKGDLFETPVLDGKTTTFYNLKNACYVGFEDAGT